MEDRLCYSRPLSHGTRRKYRGVFLQFLRQYQGHWDHTRHLQCFFDGQPAMQSLRMLQSVLNHHLTPPIPGPRIRLPPRRKTMTRHNNRETDGDLLYYIPAYIRAQLHSVDADARDKINMFVLSCVPNTQRRDLIRTWVAYVWRICYTKMATIDIKKARVQDIELALDLEFGVRPSRTTASAAVYRFLRHIVHRDNPWVGWSLVNQVKKRQGAIQRGAVRMRSVDLSNNPPVRDHFTAEEMQTILGSKMSSRDRLMLNILAQTGLRRRAVAQMTVDGILQGDGDLLRSVCHAKEKGGRLRHFVLGGCIQGLLDVYMTTDHPGRTRSVWLFPSPKKIIQPIQGRLVNNLLQRVARTNGIIGPWVHAHGVRKYVVVALVAAGNSIAQVSKWLGHRTYSTTYSTYWDLTPQELVDNMTIPWLLVVN